MKGQPKSTWAEWCILRTAGRSTLRLTASLNAAGIEAWTPIETTVRRKPGGCSGKIVRQAVLLPSYVFVRGAHETEIRVLENADLTAHPSFSIWRHAGEIIRVRHHQLHALRALQQSSYVASLPLTGRYYRKPRGEPLMVGDAVTLRTGALAGLACEVRDSTGRSTTLTLQLFGRQTEVHVSTSQLRADGVAIVASAA